MKKNTYSTPLWMLATILAGMLSPMQSAVNGQLGHWLQAVSYTHLDVYRRQQLDVGGRRLPYSAGESLHRIPTGMYQSA